MEEWRDIPGFPGYQASSLGRIRSPRKILTLTKRKKQPYLVVGIRHSKAYLVHKLVTLAFHGLPAPGEEACHRDGDHTRNHSDNLRWGTRKSNVADTFAHGRGNVGERNGQAKLTARIVATIRHDWRSSNRALARLYGVSEGTVRDARNGESWRSICP